jgi:hypothetical protein
VGSLTSHNPIGLQGLLRDSFTFFLLYDIYVAGCVRSVVMAQFHITNSSGALIIAATMIAKWRDSPDHILLLYSLLKMSLNQWRGFCLQLLQEKV